ncbi:MAG: 4-vinyl reductase, partial [archaeon GB-1867-035]|nr:4-vinyl reductase [Candidatus Culexmicrobium profundum]
LTRRQVGLIFRDIGQAYGWAIFEVKEEDDKIIIKAKDLFECSSVQVVKNKPNSQFFRGYLSGVASILWEKEMVAEEVKCIAKGDDYCEFIIKERKQ